MAKTTKTGSVDDLNAEGTAEEGLNVDDLNAGGIVHDNQQPDETDGDSADDAEDETAAPEYVVLKGNCIRHDGEIYRENLRIPVSGKDAERLLAAGVIADVQALRQRALSTARGVKITTE
ncbi:hypothetical protein ACUIG5_17795 [Raoultella ornithinolytica]|uniref:hypothetical protein n=1 Tax=Raoultella TaxID=160674 RepID=UPI000A2E8F81|nr:Uncharacterised protein [Raoultella ornithinolytica]HCT2142728.1 hypothetical protein [Raoultella ornithinolytica]